jgi:integrative and conjugative element protein (TIGR02256 family)
MPLTFSYGQTFRFQIGSIALQTMTYFIQDDEAKPESGGVMLGRYLKNCDDVVVDDITTPRKGDRQSRYRYFRAQKRHQKIIDEYWKASGGTGNYLGEWHTHPEATPLPSALDISNWRSKLRRDIYDHDSLYFVIVGQVQTGVWRGDKQTLVIEPLTPIIKTK